mgnify:CR=1 FL=1
MPDVQTARRSRHALAVRPGLLLAFAVAALFPTRAAANDPPSARVGLPFTLTEVYIPGGEVRPVPRLNREPPIVVRIAARRTAQDGSRYDFEIYGLEAGTYQLVDWLELVAPARPAQVPERAFTIATALPPGLPQPESLAAQPPPSIGGYRRFLWVAGGLWLAGLVGLIAWRRHRGTSAPTDERTATATERLRALLTEAARGELDADQQAALERLILGHWRTRVPELARLSPAEGLAALRQHEEAGPLLLQLEQWLHAPAPTSDPAAIDALLAPYREPVASPQPEPTGS